MVESQLRNFVEGKPLCLGCVVAALHFADFDQGKIGHGDHSFARIAVGICEGVELLEIGRLQTCFFAQFAQRTCLRSFVGLEKTAGKGPAPLEGFDAAANEQDVQLASVESEDHTVGGYSRMRVGIAVGKWIHFTTGVDFTPQRSE